VSSWLEDFEHPVLGAFRTDGALGWLGRSAPGADFFDLYVMRPSAGESDTPPASALGALEHVVREAETLKASSVAAVCAARQAALNWRAGPPVEAWSIVEARVDQDGALWLTLHEYETDEYSRWLVRVDAAAPEVRRIPALALEGRLDAAGARL